MAAPPSGLGWWGEQRSGAYEFVRERLREGRQAPFVCPLVEGSEKLEAKAAAEEAERPPRASCGSSRSSSSTGRCTPSRQGTGHGSLQVRGGRDARGHQRDRGGDRRAERDRDGRRGRRALWPIAAPPAARARRGAHESFCILFGDPTSETARRRLDAIATERDGFKLAEVDLTLRGEGEILGTCQSGLPRFRVAELPDDTEPWIEACRETLALLEEHDSGWTIPHPDRCSMRRARFVDEREEGIAA